MIKHGPKLTNLINITKCPAAINTHAYNLINEVAATDQFNYHKHIYAMHSIDVPIIITRAHTVCVCVFVVISLHLIAPYNCTQRIQCANFLFFRFVPVVFPLCCVEVRTHTHFRGVLIKCEEIDCKQDCTHITHTQL